MSKFRTVMDAIAYSLNELMDLIFHSILFAYVVSVLFRRMYDIGYGFFFVVPAFILCAPLFKGIHKRKPLEWVIKIPSYALLGLIIYALSYGIIGANLDGGERSSTSVIIGFLFVLIQTYWVWSTLRRLGRPIPSYIERTNKKKRQLFLSGLFAIGSLVVSITSFSFAFNLDSSGAWSELGDLVGIGAGVVLGIFSLSVGVVMSIFFIARLLERA